MSAFAKPYSCTYVLCVPVCPPLVGFLFQNWWFYSSSELLCQHFHNLLKRHFSPSLFYLYWQQQYFFRLEHKTYRVPYVQSKNSSSSRQVSGLKGPVTKVLYKGVWVQIPTGIIRIWYDKAITIYDMIPFCRSFAFLEGCNSTACCKSTFGDLARRGCDAGLPLGELMFPPIFYRHLPL